MDDGKGWLRAHWRTAAVLVMIFGLALFLRVYFVYGVAFQPVPADCSGIYTPRFSGGSDSYYWDRALCYSFQTGRDLGRDTMLNYPLAFQNPRGPLFPWFSLLVGRLVAPLFGDPWNSVMFVWLLSTALFGSLAVFPTYALAKEAFGRKAGLISAFLLAISVGNLQRSAATDADHDTFTLFFVISTFFFFLRALKTMNRHRWVESWFHGKAITAGLRAFFRENRTSVLYASLSGLSVAVIALAWQGWAYVVVILLAWFAAELFLARFRNEDTMGTWILFAIALALPVILAFQWYYVRVQIRVWFDVPAYLFLAALVLGFAFTVTRDYPWTLVIPGTLIAAGVAVGVGIVVNPSLLDALVSGAGYFIPSKVVTTIAEDQSPGMSQMILSFGLFTFGMSLLAMAYLLWQVPRRRDPAYSLVVVWAFVAIFMAITGARFIFDASPAFAVTAGFAIDQVLVRADFATMRRTYRSLAAGSWRNAVRKSVKARHVLAVIGIVFLVLVPNVWWAVDASIPFDLKAQYDQQVANLLPTFLRPGYNPSSGSPFYFGAFGYSIPKSTDYYPAAWQWFATQDTGTPPELRPAFLSWWDYGFEAVDRGDHPTVADNFQDGVALAGQFITAQNETAGIALLVARLLEGDFRLNRPNFRPAVTALLLNAGLPVDTLRSVFARPQDYIPVVLNDPITFGLWASDLQPLNAQYIFLTNLLTRRMGEEQLVTLYHDIRDATGWNIGYFAVDARLFPTSAQNTGIFYAPVKLSDHRVLNLPDGRVLPSGFFQILANTNRGQNIPIQFVAPGDQISGQTIQYQPAFYNSMFYRAYIGYSPKDLNSTDTGIPGISGALQSNPPVPAWNLTHWRVVYRTAYYNPFPDAGNHTSAFQAMNYDQAQRKQAAIQAGTIKGAVDLSTQASVFNGVVFLRYYDGAVVNGTVYAGSTPLPHVWVTVTDELGTPHGVTQTDAQGHYGAIVPFGNVTITASIGNLTRRSLVGERSLASFTLPVTIDQAMRTPADANGDGVPDWMIPHDFHVASHTAQGTVFFDLNRDGSFGATDVSAPGATVTLRHALFAYSRTVTAASDGTYTISGLPDGSYRVSIGLNGRTLSASTVTVAQADLTQGIAVPYAAVSGFTVSGAGVAVPSAQIQFVDETNSTIIPVTSAQDGSFVLRPLVAGNFTLTATDGDLASIPARVRAANTDLSFNVTLLPTGTVRGTTTLFGTAQPFATLSFQSASDPRTIRQATSDGSAEYSIRLPAGEWLVSGRFYATTALYATLGRVVVSSGGTTSFDAMFVQGIRISGTVSDANPAVRNPGATVAFTNAAGQVWLQTDSAGGYFAFLPAGTYDVQAFNQAGAYFARVGLSATTQLNIALAATSETVGWAVYRDVNRNSAVDPGEAIAGARITLTDDRGANLAFTTNATGAFQIPLFANRTYAGVVTAAGYADQPIASSSPIQLRTLMPIALAPLPVQVQGSVLVNGSAFLSHPVTVVAVALGNGAVGSSTVTDSNGGYGFGLVPGSYALVVDENVSSTRAMRYQNLGTDRIVVPVGTSILPYDIDIVARSLVVGNVTLSATARAASLEFDGPDRRAVNATTAGFEVYLSPGTYAVTGSAMIGPDEYALLSTAAVSAPTTLSFPLTKATSVSGQAFVDGVAVPGPMPVSFVRNEGGSLAVSTDLSGAYVAFLVPGNYTITLAGSNNATSAGVSRFYRYAFAGAATVTPGQASLRLDLAVTRTLDNTTVSGMATLAGLGVDASITFTARGGGAISAPASADSSGSYSVSLAPGTYDVYASRLFGSAVFLARIMVPHAATFGRDLALAQGFRLSGTLRDPSGAPVSVPVTIISAAEVDVTADSSGAYQVFLPSGVYTISASTTSTENGLPVVYSATLSVPVNADTIANLPLTKVVSRSASLTWDASQRRTIAAGGSVSYAIVVRNTGNVAETVDFAGQPGDWQFTFAPGSLPLSFGDAASSASVQVTIQSPTNALVDHGTIKIVATSDTDGTNLGSVDLQVDIARVRGLSLALDTTAPVFDGRFLNYTLLVTNSGNAQETVTLAITNPDDLTAFGWSVTLTPSGGSPVGATLTNLTVAATSTVNVALRAQSTGGPSGASVALTVSAQDSMAVSASTSFLLQLPVLASPGPTVSGPDITPAAPLNLQLLAVVVGAIAAVGAGLFLTRRRR
ncbi:MAG: hypothetical protein E6K01_03445 [Methanobacteriota archaeon]|nr:MAG: hypothetical protein E6K01_03445 [Euryarchaeota archaeon]